MIRIYQYNEIDRSEIFSRDISSTKHIEATVTEIINQVKERKDAALFEYCEKFDKVKLSSLQVSEEEIEAAVASVDPKFLEILEKAAENIYAFHSRQVRNSFVINEKEGVVIGQTVCNGNVCLKFTLLNPTLTPEKLDELLELILSLR